MHYKMNPIEIKYKITTKGEFSNNMKNGKGI